jgi:hypothetical protein
MTSGDDAPVVSGGADCACAPIENDADKQIAAPQRSPPRKLILLPLRAAVNLRPFDSGDPKIDNTSDPNRFVNKLIPARRRGNRLNICRCCKFDLV